MIFGSITANVPPALCSGGFLLLTFTNIPKSLKGKSFFKEELHSLTIPNKSLNPPLHKTAC
ncbi:hypothetical protein FLJC2902T_31740 [Flavobacterium limnosediminis JC2902]|uniref:Uncharacterized protein n=1 Tax=Flavobacterium limnosediminis JC2902 TaxID=1341181 RepID=V6SG57_9FLAO|nr:hypothetical protein FLJC2902T_31740 [Flavobacterium limnosediminis JC2902]